MQWYERDSLQKIKVEKVVWFNKTGKKVLYEQSNEIVPYVCIFSEVWHTTVVKRKIKSCTSYSTQ